jgi:L-ascorbate metabolism protein UlaG (beta-lactamase superfamily)
MHRLSHFIGLVTLTTSACLSSQAAKPVAAVAMLPLQLTYLGVAGWQIDGAQKTILVDPYFSRPNLNGPIASDPASVAAHSPARADLIVVGHSHVDHALDAPAVAIATGAQVMGSRSTAHLALAAGVPADHIIPIKGGEDYAMNGFSVRVIPSLHSALDDKHTIGGEIAANPRLPMTFNEFAEGGTFAYLLRLAGHRILILGTANFIERELVGTNPDIAIIAPGLRREIYDYTCRLMHVLGDPPTVLVTHFDDWHRPAAPAPIDEDMQAFVAEIKACSPATRVIVPTPFVPLAL